MTTDWGIIMKKIGLICTVALAGMSLVACGNQSTSKKTSSSSKTSSSKVVKHHKRKNKYSKKNESVSSNSNDTTESVNQQSASQQSEASNNSSGSDKATVAGHTFHRENFYGTDIWVGDNNEGELAEWAVNEPSLANNDSVKQQVNSLNSGQ